MGGKYYTKYQSKVHSNTSCPTCGHHLTGGRYANQASGQRVCKHCVDTGAAGVQSLYEKATNGTESDESIEEYEEEQW